MEREVHANKYGWLVSKCSKNMDHIGFAKAQGSMCFPDLHCSGPGRSAGHCPKWALSFMHFPGLSHSSSLVLYKGTDSVVSAFCALPRSQQLRRPGAWQVHCPRWTILLNHLPSPGHSVSWVCCKSTISVVGHVSSGELISGCDPPVYFNHPGPQEDVVSNWEPAHSLVENAGLWGQDCSSPLPLGSDCHMPACLPPARGRGLYAVS